MQALTDISGFLKKYNNFKYESIRNIKLQSENTILITLTTMDEDGEDVTNITLEINDVIKSRVFDNQFLPMIDMLDGINILKRNDNSLAFVLGKFDDPLNIYDSTFYIIGSSINYKEEAA